MQKIKLFLINHENELTQTWLVIHIIGMIILFGYNHFEKKKNEDNYGDPIGEFVLITCWSVFLPFLLILLIPQQIYFRIWSWVDNKSWDFKCSQRSRKVFRFLRDHM